jgi:hypothetical protein
MHAWTLYVERDGSVAAQSPLAVGVAMLHAACIFCQCIHYLVPGGKELYHLCLTSCVCQIAINVHACACYVLVLAAFQMNL